MEQTKLFDGPHKIVQPLPYINSHINPVINQSQSHINLNNNNRINNYNNPPLSNSFQTNPDLLGLSTSAVINDALAYNNLFGSNPNNPEAQKRMEQIIQSQ